MLRLVTAATQQPVSLMELKRHVEAADFLDDDEKLKIFLDAATAYVGKRCELVLAPVGYRIEMPGWCRDLQILVAPVRDIVAVRFLDANGDLQALDAAAYRWRRHATGATLVIDANVSLPALASGRDDAVQIDIDAGFDIDGATGSGDDPELVLPRQVVPAILMLAAHWYANREAAAKEAMTDIPFGVDALTRQVMIYR
jgi:uncharacterized phiE125 gp8 family phage protein